MGKDNTEMKQWSQFERLKVNTLTSLALQITQLGRGFIVPWLILHYYGANVNGLMHSIIQLIVLVSFLEAGVGPVLQAALYRPLHRHDRYGICIILKCAQEFYNKIGYVLIIYSVALVWLFPYITHKQFDVFYTGTLIVAVFVSSLSRYFFWHCKCFISSGGSARVYRKLPGHCDNGGKCYCRIFVN